MLLAPPLMDLPPPPPVSEKAAASSKTSATPVPVAPVAPMAHQVATPVVQSPAATPATTPAPIRKPQKAKCSGQRGGLAPGVSRVPPAEKEPKPVPASRTGIHMATRSKVPRGTTGISRADAAAAREAREKEEKEAAKKKEAEEKAKTPEKPPTRGGFTPVNTETLESSTSVFLKTNGKGPSSSKAKASGSGKNFRGSDTTVLNRTSVGWMETRAMLKRVDIPENSTLFSSNTIKTAFGGGNPIGPIWKIPKNTKGTVGSTWSHLVICDEAYNNEFPSAPMEPCAILDLYEWETLGAEKLDPQTPFPLFVKKGPDEYMYCGIYKMEDWNMLPLEQWKKFDLKMKKNWARMVCAYPGGRDTAQLYLREAGLPTNPTEAKVLEYFGREFATKSGPKKNALRLSRTGLGPSRYNPAIYEALCAVQTTPAGRRTSGGLSLPVAPQSTSRKRPRLEDQPADHEAITFPLSGSSRKSPPLTDSARKSARPRRSQVTPHYDLAEQSRKSIAGTGLDSDDEDVDARRTARTAGRMVISSDESEEE
jgi:hypothetical protein